MKRIYFTAVPLNFKFDEKITDEGKTVWQEPGITQMAKNVLFTKLNEEKVYWPLIHIMANTLQPEDEAIVVTVRQENKTKNSAHNMRLLLDEFALLEHAGLTQKDPEHPAPSEIVPKMCNAEIATGYKNIRLMDITVEENQNDDVVLGMFEEMIACLEDDAIYYACMTFGTKSYPVCLFSALAYAEKVKTYAEVGGIYYQEKKWTVPGRPQTLYNVTALFKLNSIVDMVAQMPVSTEEMEKMIHELM